METRQPDTKPQINAGFQLFYPEVSDRANFAARTDAALQVADGCNYYNFGLVPNARLSWLSKNYPEAYD